MNENKIIVSIICLAYNHEQYIRQCIEGFITQKTNFAFEIIIHDDASTDNTAVIIKEYEEKFPHIIKPIYQKENQYSKGIKIGKTYLYPKVQGKYIAECEGDDYWIDPYKLQKQVDILENNPNYGLCYTSAKVYNQKKECFSNILSLEYQNFESLLIHNPITTLTVLYRKSFLESYYININPENKGWLMGDYPLWLWIASQSHIYFIKDITAVYRHLENSASHHTNPQKQERFNASIRDVRIFFQKLILPNKDLEDKFNDDFYRRNALFGITHNNRNYCFSNIKHVKNKNWKDKLKQILCFNKLSFSILRFIILKKI